LPKIKTDGWIGGHDYTSSWPGVIKAVDELLGPPKLKFVDSSWLFKKVDVK